MYTQKMGGGVDLCDQQTAQSCLQHRMLKWWKKVTLCNLLEISVTNAKIIHKSLHPTSRMKPYLFRLALITGLLQGYERPSKPFARPLTAPATRLTERHFLSYNPNTQPSGKRSNPECEVCSDRKKKRHQTLFVCAKCNNVPLCLVPCFERYHTIDNYKVDCSPGYHGSV